MLDTRRADEANRSGLGEVPCAPKSATGDALVASDAASRSCRLRVGVDTSARGGAAGGFSGDSDGTTKGASGMPSGGDGGGSVN